MSAVPDPSRRAENLFLGVERSVTGKAWRRRAFDARAAAQIAQVHGLDPLLAEVIASRGIDAAEVERFLNPSLRTCLPDPNCLKDMDRAAARLASAVMAGETVGIFGDYDVDGTTSAALLTRYFQSLGTPVAVHLPDRQAEGYGPNLPAFESLAERGAALIVTVDCGANAHDVIGAAAARGIETIVLDHHGMTDPPPALATVNPNRPDCGSGLGNLSAGGVVFMTMVATNRALREAGHFKTRKEPSLLPLLDLVALSLVCDVMELKGLTRVLTRQGLAVLADFDRAVGGNPGIRALAAEAKAKGVAQAHHFGFAIGPRINAAGRIGHAKMAYDLLTTDDPGRAAELAARLSDLNGVRQGVESAVLEEAVRQGTEKGGADPDTPLVVAAEGWHPGVIGIVAGRLKERFGRPAIVISFEGEEGKGSGRSLPGVDLGEAIGRARAAGVLTGGGGHPMAAGLSLTRDQLAAFDAFLADDLGAATRAARANRSLHLDGAVAPRGLCRTLHDGLQQAGPFGNGNPEPRFAMADLRIRDIRILKEKHVALTVEDRHGRRARCISFGCIGQPLGDFFQAAADGAPIHLAGRVKPDDYRGGDAAQFHVEDGAFA